MDAPGKELISRLYLQIVLQLLEAFDVVLWVAFVAFFNKISGQFKFFECEIN